MGGKSPISSANDAKAQILEKRIIVLLTPEKKFCQKSDQFYNMLGVFAT